MNNFTKFAVAAAAVFSLQAQAAVGDVFDGFTVDQFVQDLTQGGAGTGIWSGAVAGADIFGGKREIYVEKTSNASTVVGIQAGVDQGRFFFNEGTGQIGHSILRYDGGDLAGNAGPDYTALLGNLLTFGTGFAFTYSSDLDFDIQIKVYDITGAVKSQTLGAIGTGGTDQYGEILFADLVGAADLTKVGAVEIIFNQLTGTGRVDLDFTAPTGIPEPGSLALAGLALLGLGAARRRKA